MILTRIEQSHFNSFSAILEHIDQLEGVGMVFASVEGNDVEAQSDKDKEIFINTNKNTDRYEVYKREQGERNTCDC